MSIYADSVCEYPDPLSEAIVREHRSGRERYGEAMDSALNPEKAEDTEAIERDEWLASERRLGGNWYRLGWRSGPCSHW